MLNKYSIALVLIALWTGLAWYQGFQFGRGEQDKLQAQIDEAYTANKDLSLDLQSANNKLSLMASESRIKLDQWKAQHEGKAPAPASKCVGETDYFGKKAADKFMERQEKQMEAWLGGQDE